MPNLGYHEVFKEFEKVPDSCKIIELFNRLCKAAQPKSFIIFMDEVDGLGGDILVNLMN